MKKISIIISIVTAIIFTLIILLSGGKVVDLNAASLIGPLAFILMYAFLIYWDLTFEKSGKETLHTNESVLYTYEERVAFYKARGTILFSGFVSQIFLIFCFGVLWKSLICTLAFMLSYGLAMFFAGYSVKDEVNARLMCEEKELKIQIAREEQGKI